MADGIELATAYVTLIPSLKGASKQIQSQIEGLDLKGAGKALGKNLGASIDTSGLEKYKAAVRSAQKAVEQSAEKQADALKKVEVAQKRLAEARSRYGSDSSQAAQAELELTRAERQAAMAAGACESAQKRLAAAQDALKSATESAEAAVKAQESALGRLSSAATKAGRGLQTAGSKMKTAGSALGSAGDALMPMTATLATAGAAAGAFAIKTASAAETSEIAFTTMLGSAEAAETMMGQLADFAASTPFELTGLTSATQQLLAYGFTAEDVIPMLTAVGDATAALGTGQSGIEAVTRALGQMQTRGKVSAEEMLQLTEAGIPAWEYLARAIGTDTAGAMAAVSEGAVDASTGIQALTKGMEEDFGGMMESQSKTVAGLMSNLADSLTQPLMELRDTQGYEDFADALSEIVDAAEPFVESLLPHLSDGLSMAAGVMEGAADAMDAFASMSDEGQEAVLGIATAAIAAAPALKVAGTGMDLLGTATEKAGGLLEAIGGKTKAASTALSGMEGAASVGTAALGKMGGAVTALANPLTLLGTVGAVSLGVLGTAILKANARADELAAREQLVSDATEDVASIMGTATGSIDGMGDAIGALQPDVEGTLQSMAKLNESTSELLGETLADSARLDQYTSIIGDLAGKSGLSATEQYRLAEAVKGYNSIVGTQYSVVDAANGVIADQNGVIQTNTDEINENASAWKNRAYAQALSDTAGKYMQEEIESAYELSAAQEQLNDTTKRRDELQKRIDGTSDKTTQHYRDMVTELTDLNAQIDEQTANVQDLATVNAQASQTASDFSAMAELQSAAFGTLGDGATDFVNQLATTGISLTDFASLSDEQLQTLMTSWDGTSESITTALTNMGQTALVEGANINSALMGFQSGEVATALQSAGVNIDALSTAMAQAGITSQQLNEIGSANFTALAANCGGNIDQLIWQLQNYNGTPIVDKNGNITADSTQLRAANGEIYTWNGQVLKTQSGQTVVAYDQLKLANGEVLTWNQQGLPTINGTALADATSLEAANGDILEWNGSQLVDQQGRVIIDEQQLTDCMGNIVEYQGQNLDISGTVYCSYDELTAALGSIDSLRSQDGYTATVYLNTVQTTTRRTVYESSGGEEPQSLSVMPLSAPMAAPANAGISLLADAPAPVYAAGDDGIARPIALAAAPRAVFGTDAASAALGYIGAVDARGIEDAADALRDLNRALKDTYGITKDFNPDEDDAIGQFVKGISDAADESQAAQDDLKRMGQIFERTGVQFSEGFVDVVISGEGAYAENLDAMVSMTDEQLQQVVDLYDAAAKADAVKEYADGMRDMLKGISDAAEESRDGLRKMKSMNSMLQRTGVAFSKDFIGEIASGTGVYAENIELLGDLTDEQLQRVVDIYDASKANERISAFTERVYDLAGALADDDGLARAFRWTGEDLTDFTARMDEFGLTVDDITAKVSEFSGKVSDGFSIMSKPEDKTAKAWAEGLNQNIITARAWAAEVDNVFNRLDRYGDYADDFRKEVLAGGFEEYGQVISDMTEMTDEEIMGIVNLYNTALAAGTHFGTNIINDIIPDTSHFEGIGEDIAGGIAQGIENGTAQAVQAMQQLCSQVEQAARTAMDIHSPSRAMRKLFGYVGDGAAEGIVQSGRGAVEAMRDVCEGVSGAVGSVRFAPASWAMGAGGPQTIEQTVNFNQPMQTPAQVAYAMKRYATYGLAGAR